MKIIIAYASAGSGHFKAAQALYNYLGAQNKNLELKLTDALDKSNILFRNIYSSGYIFTINHAIYLWTLGYRITYARYLKIIIKWIRFIINRLNLKEFTKFLIQENPDFIISTHFLPAEVSTYLKRVKKLNSKLITVITDFGIHPFWISKGIDIYIVASDFTKEQLMREGIEENKIKVWGIPIDSKFLKQCKKDILCRKFNIEQNKFTVLIITGSFGIGPIEEIVNLLNRQIQMLVVCANNKRLYARLKNKHYPDVKVFGFVDNIQELMAVSDIIITKPGGLTISEVLVMELVPIFISPIPGQETENVGVLERYGVGLSVRHAQDIRDIVLDYKENPDKLEKARVNIRKIKKPYAVQELCNAICKNSIRAAN